MKKSKEVRTPVTFRESDFSQHALNLGIWETLQKLAISQADGDVTVRIVSNK